jgi:hydroxymethylpyrimidine pyrophosphatase-like HAD family hydrolase
MTFSELREACNKRDHGLAGYYNGGELYVNSSDGRTLYNRGMDRETAEDLCEHLGLSLTEV